jgi:group I intron endonuclease
MVTPGIYSITSKATQKIYIGSSRDVVDRWKQHQRSLRGGRHRNAHLQSHFNKYGLDDLVFEVLEVEPNPVLRLGLETLMIRAWWGGACFNQSKDANSGMGGRHLSPEHKAKIAAGLKGQKRTPESRARMSVAQKGSTKPPLSPERKARISAATKGRVVGPHSAELRAKISASKKGKPGHPHSAETKAKIAAANRGVPKSAETKIKLSATAKKRGVQRPAGWKHTPETRAKMSANHRTKKPA